MPNPNPEAPFLLTLRSYLHARIGQSRLKPAEIARQAGIAPALLYRFLNEQRDLSLETIDKILPVIDAKIESKMRAFIMQHEEFDAQQQAMAKAMEALQSQEGAIESAILSLNEVMGILLKVRAATGTEFHEAMGFELPETPESIDAELRALMESDIVPPDEPTRSLGDEFRDLMESDDTLDETPEVIVEDTSKSSEPDKLYLTEADEPNDPDLLDPTDLEGMD